MKVFIGIIAQCRRPVTQAAVYVSAGCGTQHETPGQRVPTRRRHRIRRAMPGIVRTARRTWLGLWLRAHGQRQQAGDHLAHQFAGVWLCTKAIICTLNNVERTISMKLHTATTT